MQMMTEQGMTIDFQSLINLFAEYASIPEIKDIIKQQPMPEEDQQQSMGLERPMQSPNTTRRYVRENRPSNSDDGFKRSMMANLMGAKQQGAEQERMSSPLMK
jgi:hypothetical protein